MKRAIIAGLVPLLLAVAGPAHADERYKSRSTFQCAGPAWHTCATPFYDARSFSLASGNQEVASYCVKSMTADAGCLSVIQRGRIDQIQALWTGYPFMAGLGPGIDITMSGDGGTLTIIACNNDPEWCPGEIDYTLSVSAPPGVLLLDMSDACLKYPPVSFCAGPY